MTSVLQATESGKDAAMTTFDLPEALGFASDLDAGMDRCDNNEGPESPTLDDVLQTYAQLCREFCDQIRQWGDAVFSGRSEFDTEVERVLKEGGSRLYARASAILAYARQRAVMSSPPYESHLALHAALWDLDRLLKGWVTPKLAVGPSAKRWRHPEQAATEEGRRRVASLPPLPADWQPHDPQLRALYRKMRPS
jgi:hypothetical protein